MLQKMTAKITAEGEKEDALYQKFVCYCKNNKGDLSPFGMSENSYFTTPLLFTTTQNLKKVVWLPRASPDPPASQKGIFSTPPPKYARRSYINAIC